MGWIFKDFFLVLALLALALLSVLGVAGYLFDIQQLWSEKVRWGLTGKDIVFMGITLSFLLVVGRLLWRVRTAEAKQPLGAVEKELRGSSVLTGEGNFTFLAVFMALADSFALSVSNIHVGSVLQKKLGGKGWPLNSLDILAKFTTLGLVSSQRVDPALGSPSSIRDSVHDVPYQEYRFTDLGRRLALKLMNQKLGSGKGDVGS